MLTQGKSFSGKSTTDSAIQCLAKQTDFWGFFIQNRVRREGKKLPKCYVKTTNFFSIACTNVGSFLQNF